MASYFKALSRSFSGPNRAGRWPSRSLRCSQDVKATAVETALYIFVVENPPAPGSVLNQSRLEADSQESSNFRDRCAL